MIEAVLLDIRVFLIYYSIVMFTFSLLMGTLFDSPNEDCEGLGTILGFFMQSFRIVWGEGSFEIKDTNYKAMAWFSYILIMLIGNIVFMNFLISVVN